MVSLLTAFLLSITGCTFYSGSETEENGVRIEINDFRTEAFASDFYWDWNPEHTEIIIPDEAEGVPVRSLGGFTGTGVPAPFQIIPEGIPGVITDYNPDPDNYGVQIVWEETVFTVRIGINLDRIDRFLDHPYFGFRDGGMIRFYRPVFLFVCEEENPAFYARDGILYEKETGDPALDPDAVFPSGKRGPVFSELEFQRKISGRYFLRMGEDETAILEVLSENGRVFLNIGQYMDESLYVFSGGELVPEFEKDLKNRETDVISCSVWQFSDFSMAGSFWGEEPAGYTLTVSEDFLLFSDWNGKGEPILSGDMELRFKRDISAPSMFPSDLQDLSGMLEEGEWMAETIYKDWLTADGLYAGTNPIRIRRDGTITLICLHEKVPVVFHGICALVRGSDLMFAVSKVGGGTMPYTGRIQIESGEEILFRRAEGKDCYPLIPEGQEMMEVHRTGRN